MSDLRSAFDDHGPGRIERGAAVSFTDRPPSRRTHALALAVIATAGPLALATLSLRGQAQGAKPAHPQLVAITFRPEVARPDQAATAPKRTRARAPVADGATPIGSGKVGTKATSDSTRPPAVPSSPAAPQIAPIVIPTTSAPAPPVEAQGDDTALAAYAAQLRSIILRRQLAGIGTPATTTIAFSLTPSGTLISAEIARPSGVIRLDRAALRLVRDAAPFPPAPPSIPAGSLNFTVAIRFH